MLKMSQLPVRSNKPLRLKRSAQGVILSLQRVAVMK